MPEPQRMMPRYECHKIVHALKIERVEETGEWGTLYFWDAAFDPRRVPNTYMAKHNPQPGGYYVVYEDKYESFSPPEPFEKGYALIPE